MYFSFVYANKCCIFCKKSKVNQDKAVHQKDLIISLQNILKDAADACESGSITHSEHIEIYEYVKKMEIGCSSCDGKLPIVNKIIEGNELIIEVAGMTKTSTGENRKGAVLKLVHFKKEDGP